MRATTVHALWLGAATGILATLIAQGCVLLWRVYSNTPAMNSPNRTTVFVHETAQRGAGNPLAWVQQLSIAGDLGFVEAEVSIYQSGSPMLPPGLDQYWTQNEAAVPGPFRALTAIPWDSRARSRLFRAFGWPYPCFRAAASWGYQWESSGGIVLKSEENANQLPGWREFIPTDIYLPALVANLLVIGVPIGGLVAFFHARRSWLARGKCPSCGYDMAGLPSNAGCPECGAARPLRQFPAVVP